MKIDIIIVYLQRYEKGHELDFVPPVTGIHLAALTSPEPEVRVIHQQVEPIRAAMAVGEAAPRPVKAAAVTRQLARRGHPHHPIGLHPATAAPPRPRSRSCARPQLPARSPARSTAATPGPSL